MEPDRGLPRVKGVRPDDVATLYALACPRLIGFLTVLGGNDADAEEVAQNAFVRLLQHWPKVREYDDQEAWLRTVALRLMISRHRRRQVASLGLRRLAAHVHDLRVDEIARELGAPVGTVKSRLARARAALAPLLADETRSTT